MSSYVFFCKDEMPKLHTERPELSLADLAKEVGSRWSNMSPAEKAPYEMLAKEDEKRYQREKDAFLTSIGTRNY